MTSYSIITCMGILGKEAPGAYSHFIYSKWLRSLRYGNDYFKLVDSDAYYNAYHRYIENILTNPETTVRLAVLTDDKDVILGFSVANASTLHYVYVHKDQRRLGIGTKLLPPHIDSISHLTRTGLIIWASKYAHLKFNPF